MTYYDCITTWASSLWHTFSISTLSESCVMVPFTDPYNQSQT